MTYADRTPLTIILTGADECIRKEAVAAAAITPGHLVEMDPAGTYTAPKVRVHSTAAGNARKAFALENDIIGNGIDDAYAALDSVLYAVACPGHVVNGLVAPSAPAIAIGDALESAGNGTVRKHADVSIVESGSATKTVPPASIVGWALEAVDNSANADTSVRIRFEVA